MHYHASRLTSGSRPSDTTTVYSWTLVPFFPFLPACMRPTAASQLTATCAIPAMLALDSSTAFLVRCVTASARPRASASDRSAGLGGGRCSGAPTRSAGADMHVLLPQTRLLALFPPHLRDDPVHGRTCKPPRRSVPGSRSSHIGADDHRIHARALLAPAQPGAPSPSSHTRDDETHTSARAPHASSRCSRSSHTCDDPISARASHARPT
ncbi:hypothetical protein C8J57DRAFT_1520321 [Mycena rebaudengoi]|nr:hypothetical protein C8J57DRAFT_1520321 [Mycena rebaudengoi]